MSTKAKTSYLISPMQDFKNEEGTVLYKILLLVAYVIVGLMGKISNMMFAGKKMTWMEVVGSMGMALFVGFLASAYCWNKGLDDEAKLIVPLATYLSDKISMVLMRLKYKEIFMDIQDIIKKRL